MMMTTPEPIHRYTPEEYYRLEAQADHRSEFYNGEIFAMAGGSARHSMIGGNVLRHFGNKLEGTRCVPFGSDLKLKVKATGLRTYPDGSVYRGDRELDPEDPAGQTYTSPTALVEVLSPSTESYDRGVKAYHYRHIESLRVILLVSQEAPRVETHVRQPDGSWCLREFDGMEQVLRLDAIGVELPFTAIYQGVDFSSDK
jgi:Uma2 family endonuclease